jgi:hypothetical protein
VLSAAPVPARAELPELPDDASTPPPPGAPALARAPAWPPLSPVPAPPALLPTGRSRAASKPPELTEPGPAPAFG